MRRLIAAVFAALIAAVASAQNYYDFSDPSIPLVAKAQNDGRVVSGHSISASILGLEYAYEQRLGGNWSMVFRAGAPCVLTYAARTVTTNTYSSGNYNTSDSSVSYTFNWGPRPGLTIEPRYYTNMERRSLKGKNTANNCADFIALRTVLYAGLGAYDMSSLDLSAIGMYGIRRGNAHWFREYTFGVGYHTKFMFFLPHINFRIGYTF